MSLDFGGVLRRAWQLTWNYKLLWLFGVFSAALAGSGGGRPGGNFQFDFNNPRQIMPSQLRSLDETTVWLILLGVAALIILLGIVLFILAIYSRGALIGGVLTADQQSRVSFGEASAFGRKYFWTVLGIGLVVWVVGLALGLMSIISFLTVCLAPLACIGFIVIALLGVYARLAQITAINDAVGLSEALPRAWRFITTNLGSVFLMGLILVILQAVISFVAALPFIALALPAILVVIGYANDAPIAGNVGLAVAGLCVVAYLPILIVLSGIVETWVMAAWTLTYKQLTGRAPAPAAPAALPA
ncbi:MAG: hypothetical protein IT317_15010 [Anaerolineales bacterium]|nr:hypothetical protein [Anaerolineales bacterium]